MLEKSRQVLEHAQYTLKRLETIINKEDLPLYFYDHGILGTLARKRAFQHEGDMNDDGLQDKVKIRGWDLRCSAE